MKTSDQIQAQYLENKDRLCAEIETLLEGHYQDSLDPEKEEELRLCKKMFTWEEEYFLEISMTIHAQVQGEIPVSLRDFILHGEGGDTGFDYEIDPDHFHQTGDALLYDGCDAGVNTSYIKVINLQMK